LFTRSAAEGCVVLAGNEIPDEKIAADTHYKIIGDTLEQHKKFWTCGNRSIST
jgi:hypothetical protein